MIKEYIIKIDEDQSKKDIHGGYPLIEPPLELVRCKDCVHWIPGTITDRDDFIQPRCRRNGGGWLSDEYCSNAERREQDA